MGRRSSIDTLPPEIRQRLDKELVQRGFSRYQDLEELMNLILQDEGYEVRVSRSSIQRYGARFQERLEQLRQSTELAKVIATELDDDEGAMNDALVRIYQSKLLDVIQDLDLNPGNIDPHKVGKVIGDLARASITQKKYMAEVREKAKAAAQAATDVAKRGGLSKDAVNQIRASILGITAG